MHSYELSDRLLQPTDWSYPTPNRMKPKGHQCMIQYFCRPEIFEKYDMDDYFIRHPSYAHDFSVEYPNEFVKAMHHFAVAGYESDSDSEVYESDTDMDNDA